MAVGLRNGSAPDEVGAHDDLLGVFPGSGVRERAQCVCGPQAGPETCWDVEGRSLHVASHRKVLDQLNRAEAVPDPPDRCGKRRLPDGAFDAMAGGEPVLDNKFKDIMERDGWASPSPHTFNLSVAAFQLLLSVHRAQKWAEVGNAWKAVFFMTPMIVAFAPVDNVYVVLDSSPYGLWLWPCERRTTDFMATIVVSTSPTSAPLFKPVFDFKDWQVTGVKPSTPLSIRHGGSRAGVSDCIHMRVVGSPEDVLVYAAEHAFGDATDHWLGALMNYLGLRCDSGSNEWTLMAKIDTLVRHLLPGISDDEVAAILAMRAKTRKATSGEQLATSMRNGGMQAMDTVCDPSDKQAWEKEADSIDFDPALVEKLLAYFATRKYKVPPSLEKADMVAKKKVAVQRGGAGVDPREGTPHEGQLQEVPSQED